MDIFSRSDLLISAEFLKPVGLVFSVVLGGKNDGDSYQGNSSICPKGILWTKSLARHFETMVETRRCACFFEFLKPLGPL